MDVSIIIVNYKTTDLILNCLKSVYSLIQGVSFEVIVVDNKSDDNYDVEIKSRYPEVICISLPENVGFGRANNEGLKVASGRNILFLNPDTVLLNDAVSILSKYLDSNAWVGACGGNLYDEELKPALSYKRIFPSIFWEVSKMFRLYPEKILFGKNQAYNRTTKPLKVAYITGADLMVKRDVLMEVGVFSPSFFMYYEETDFCYRIKSRGYEIISVPDAKIQHLEGKSFTGEGKINLQKMTFEEIGRLNFYKRNYNSLICFVANFIYQVNLVSRVLILRNGYMKEYYSARLKVFKQLKHKS